MPKKLRKVKFWTGIKSLKIGIGIETGINKMHKNFYIHMFKFAAELDTM